MSTMHAVVKGKVQGVWFRAWTSDLAAEMKLSGWVRNMSDGNVELEASGSRDELDEFLERLHDGPPLARVTEVETQYRESDAHQGAFRVVR